MRTVLLISLSTILALYYAQQTEQTFTVKKRSVETKKEFQRIFDLKLAPGIDTICRGIWLDLEPVKPYYDSISTFNLKLKPINKKWTMLQTTTVGNGGHGILKFYQKQKDGTYKLIYIRNWVINCTGRK